MATVAQIRKRIEKAEQAQNPSDVVILWNDGSLETDRLAAEAEARGHLVVRLSWYGEGDPPHGHVRLPIRQ